MRIRRCIIEARGHHPSDLRHDLQGGDKSAQGGDKPAEGGGDVGKEAGLEALEGCKSATPGSCKAADDQSWHEASQLDPRTRKRRKRGPPDTVEVRSQV